MRLVAVYFPGLSDTGLPYRKAMVYEEDKAWFLSKGAVEEQPTEVAKEVAKKVVKNETTRTSKS